MNSVPSARIILNWLPGGAERIPGRKLYIREYNDGGTGQPQTEKLFLSTRVLINNADIKGRDRLAIVPGGKVLNAPVVQSNLSKSFSINGLGKPGEAEQLAKDLSSPPPPDQQD